MTSINSREKIYSIPEYNALHPTGSVQMAEMEHSFNVDLVVDFTQIGDDRVHSDSEES